MHSTSSTSRFRKGILLITVVFLFHALSGVAAVLMGGQFFFGATAFERFLDYKLNNPEASYSFSGAEADFIDDLCFNECVGCPTLCYSPGNLRLVCSGLCVIETVSGRDVAVEGQYFKHVLKNGLLIEDSTFMCYDTSTGDCGFTIDLGGNYTMTYSLPEDVEVIS